jgi:hypothetical protein
MPLGCCSKRVGWYRGMSSSPAASRETKFSISSLLREKAGEYWTSQRVVKNLRWAELADEPPFAFSNRGRTPAQKEGLRYEKQLKKWLEHSFRGEILYQPWINFEDDNGEGWASPDFVLTPHGRESHRLLVDAKLTATWRAEAQLRGLYLPLLQALMKSAKFTTLQVAKNLAGLRTEVLSIDDVMALPPDQVLYTWHWMP